MKFKALKQCSVPFALVAALAVSSIGPDFAIPDAHADGGDFKKFFTLEFCNESSKAVKKFIYADLGQPNACLDGTGRSQLDATVCDRVRLFDDGTASLGAQPNLNCYTCVADDTDTPKCDKTVTVSTTFNLKIAGHWAGNKAEVSLAFDMRSKVEVKSKVSKAKVAEKADADADGEDEDMNIVSAVIRPHYVYETGMIASVNGGASHLVGGFTITAGMEMKCGVTEEIDTFIAARRIGGDKCGEDKPPQDPKVEPCPSKSPGSTPTPGMDTPEAETPGG